MGDKFGNKIPITLFLFNDCLIYGYYEYNRLQNGYINNMDDDMKQQNGSNSNEINIVKEQRKGKLRFGSILVFDELFEIKDVAFNEEYNYQKISCLIIRARHHAIWISFHSFDAKMKWFEMIKQQNEKERFRRMKSPKCIQNNYKKKQNELYLPLPVFVPDDYSDVCMECKSEFSVFNRRHHCYICGILCCNQCTKYKCIDIWKLYFEEKKELVRVCKICKIEREQYLKQEMDDDDVEVDNVDELNIDDQDTKRLSTIDIVKSHQKSCDRLTKRRNKMHRFKQKSFGDKSDKLDNA